MSFRVREDELPRASSLNCGEDLVKSRHILQCVRRRDCGLSAWVYVVEFPGEERDLNAGPVRVLVRTGVLN